MTVGYIYIVSIEGSTCTHKIGRTKAPEKRFNAYRTIAGDRFKIVGVVHVSNMIEAERLLKRKYKLFQTKTKGSREIYDISENEAKRALHLVQNQFPIETESIVSESCVIL